MIDGAPSQAEGRYDQGAYAPRQRRLHTRGYSRFVSMMKFLLPAGATVLIALVVLWPHLDADDLKFRIGFAALNSTQSKDPSMVNPRYLGTDRDNQPFAVTADLARQLATGGAKVELEMPKADITLEDGTWLVLTAESGIFGRDSNTLDLSGSVNLYHDSGYEFRTRKAAIDLNGGNASGNEPVVGQGPFGNLEAEGFRMVDKGKTIFFSGKSKLTLYPSAEKPGK